MAIVPRISETRVRQTAPGSPRISTDASLEAFGGGASLERKSQATSGLISAASGLVEQEIRKADDALFLEGINKIAQFNQGLSAERQKTKGKNAGSLIDSEQNQSNDFLNKVLNEAGNNRARKRIKNENIRFDLQRQSSLNKYVSSESKKFQQEQFNASVTNEINAGAKSLDKKAMAVSLASINKTIDERGLNGGESADVIKLQKAQAAKLMEETAVIEAKTSVNSMIDADPSGTLKLLQEGAFNDFLAKDEIADFEDEARTKFNDQIEEDRQDKLIKFLDQNAELAKKREKNELDLSSLYDAEKNTIAAGGSKEDIDNIRTLRKDFLRREPKSVTEQSNNFELINQELDSFGISVRKVRGEREVDVGSAQLEELLRIQNKVMRMTFTGEIDDTQAKVLNKRLIPATNQKAKTEKGKAWIFLDGNEPYDSAYRIIQDHVESNNLTDKSFSKSQMLGEMFRQIDLGQVDKMEDSAKMQERIKEIANSVIKIDFSRRHPSTALLEDTPNAILKKDGTVETARNIDTKLKETSEIKGNRTFGRDKDGNFAFITRDPGGKIIKIEEADSDRNITSTRNF